MTSQSYKASGRYSYGSILLYLICGLLGGFILGAAYVYLLGYLSNMLLRSLVLIGLVVLLSGYLVLLVRVTKIRNTKIVMLLSIIILLLVYYNNWVVYVNLVQDVWQRGANEVWAYHFQFPQLLGRWGELFISPGVLISAIVRILPTGIISINGQILKGIPLLIVWILEFLLTVVLPVYNVAYRAGRPYEEEKGLWLPKREEWTIGYLDTYREIRGGLRNDDITPLMDALQNVEFYQLQGQESYALIEFYRNGSYIGPYISITNVKAIQVGPRKLHHKAITVITMMDVGSDLAKDLYRRVKLGYDTYEKQRPKFNVFSLEAWGDKLRNFTFNLSRKKNSVTSELKSSARTKKYSGRKAQLQKRNSEDEPVSIEEITVHVPRITPEMEKEYLDRKKNH